MSEIKISSTGWLAIYLRNGNVGMFDLNDTSSWQYLQVESIEKQSKDVNNDLNYLNRNLIKFSPNGEFLVVNGQNEQLYIYIQSNFEKSEVWWKLQRIICVKNFISAMDLNNEFLLIADKSGDIYKIDLLFNNTTTTNNNNLMMTAENCIMRHLSMLLDIAFIRINDKKSFILTADQYEKIQLIQYPNTSHSGKYCLGHTEFVSHIKLIDNNHILSASGDGTLRLWHLPDCIPLVLLHSKALTLSSKQIFYTQLYDSNSSLSLEDYQQDTMSQESSLDLSSTLDYSIWKMDVASYNSINSNVYIAFSIYAHRLHSIYLTSLSNIKQLINEQRQLIFDISYGTIIDYCFPSKDILFNDYTIYSKCNLYILFDSYVILNVNIISILLSDQTKLFVKPNQTIQEINNILASRDIHLMNYNIKTDEIVFQQLFKNSNNNSCHKRKLEIVEQQQQQQQQIKKQMLSSQSDNEIQLT
ncbi:unnamed protein product [Rotaria sordida]|uniref:WD repeat-containing protein 4 homolog n=1 Tax=Rotaria sordida TaxID=392033 RepID=A0A814A3X9_9BILA|nr:unnamed protein product [Rotaria sordida]CAF3555322.1 unnamed protein product [Rotaria sordida]